MGNSHGPSLLPMEARGHGAATQKRSVFFGTRRFNLAHRVSSPQPRLCEYEGYDVSSTRMVLRHHRGREAPVSLARQGIGSGSLRGLMSLGRDAGRTGGRLSAGSKAQTTLAALPRVRVVHDQPAAARRFADAQKQHDVAMQQMKQEQAQMLAGAAAEKAALAASESSLPFGFSPRTKAIMASMAQAAAAAAASATASALMSLAPVVAPVQLDKAHGKRPMPPPPPPVVPPPGAAAATF